MADKAWRQSLTPLYAFGVLRVLAGMPQTGAEMRLALRECDCEAADCELWAKLFDTFANEHRTAATERLLRQHREAFAGATVRVFRP